MYLLSFCAYAIEEFYAPRVRRFDGPAMPLQMFSLVLLNQAAIILFPLAAVRLHAPYPPVALGLLATSLTMLLKTISFHHVLLDQRRAMHANEDFDLLCFGCPLEAAAAKKYPSSLSFSHYVRFLFAPTLCFQYHYPSTTRIRWRRVCIHIAAIILSLGLMKIIIDQYIAVTLRNAFASELVPPVGSLLMLCVHFFERLLTVSIPNLYVWLLIFFGIFHHHLNLLAELTHFADREFYQMWWNSRNFKEYWQRWNLPVHHFLHRHVYKPLLRKQMTRTTASLVVFLVSAVAHEYAVAEAIGVPYTGLVLVAFLAQIPLQALTQTEAVSRRPMVGNFTFWITFCFTGQPAAVLFYYFLFNAKRKSLVGFQLPLLASIAA
eukprot:GHVU01115981.1.p1 GENE.GHVU01115981.1~~GHVU01115981.1.p1  ORF type:complete len:377 (+),score=54.38 GHVU01115981.1:890-2020(+)